MKQHQPLRRTRWLRRRKEWEMADEDKPWAPATVLPVARGTYGGAGTVARPKTVPQRNRRLLELAENMPCLLLVPGCCNHRIDTTVACHSNLSIHGKAGRRKADDQYSVHGCAACHWWLDFGPAPEAQKTAVFMDGLARMVLVLRQIAADSARPMAERRAAQWGLDRLEVSP
jgi:hypothetical protein